MKILVCKRVLLLSGLIIVWGAGCATQRVQRPAVDLEPVLRAHGGFSNVLARAPEFRVQVLISEVETNRAGELTLRRHGYRLGAEYFYPASTVKLGAAVAALLEIERLAVANNVTDLLDLPVEISPLFPGVVAQGEDASNLNSGKITVGHEIRKTLIVSDNPAFNRLFDLVGHEQMNRALHDLGLRSVVINHRLSEVRSVPDPLASAAVDFILPGKTIRVPARASQLDLTNRPGRLQIDAGYMKGATLVAGPMDFTRRNGISLVDLQDLLIKVVAPEIELGTPALRLSPMHRAALVRALTEYPRESKNPIYSPERYADDYRSFLLAGVRRVFPATQPGERIEIAGKTGQAYGFSIENSVLRHPQSGRAVFVAAVIYANSDGILNDDKYDYATVAKPFLADLGEFVARRWLVD